MRNQAGMPNTSSRATMTPIVLSSSSSGCVPGQAGVPIGRGSSLQCSPLPSGESLGRVMDGLVGAAYARTASPLRLGGTRRVLGGGQRGGIVPTGRDTANPAGLMKAARSSRDAQARVEAAATALRDHLAWEEGFATRFDEAVMREDRETVLACVAEAGVPEDVKVTIEELDADRSIMLRFCIWVVCIS